MPSTCSSSVCAAARVAASSGASTVLSTGSTPARRTAVGSSMSGCAARITRAATSKISAELQ